MITAAIRILLARHDAMLMVHSTDEDVWVFFVPGANRHFESRWLCVIVYKVLIWEQR